MSLPTKQEAIRLGLAIIRDPGLRLILERHALYLTVCTTCRVDDFTHVEGCALAARVEEVWEWFEDDNRKEEQRPPELGPLVYWHPESTPQGEARADQRREL